MKCPKCNGQMRLIGIHGDAKELTITYQCQADYVSLGRTFSAAGGLLVAINRAAEADWWPMPSVSDVGKSLSQIQESIKRTAANTKAMADSINSYDPHEVARALKTMIDDIKKAEARAYKPAPKADWGGFEKIMGDPPDKSQI